MASSPLPQSVRVGPFVWTVRSDPKLEDFGLTCADDLEIVIRGGLPDDLRKETVLHELLHAILFAQGVPSGTQEKWVKRLSPFLFATLRDDADLRRFLFGR